MSDERKELFTVGALAEELKKLPSTAQIYMAVDEEGNGFGVVDEVSPDECGRFILWPRHQFCDFEDEEVIL